MQLVISLSFVKLLWPFLRDAFHTPMIKITYTPHIFPTSTLEVVQEYFIHSIPQNKNSMLFMAILSKLQGRGLLKKISGHMKVQGIQKRKKRNLDTWRSNVFQKKVSPCPKENKREIAHERSSYIIHKFHILAHLDQVLWLVSPKGSGLWLSNTRGTGMPSTFPYPELHISLSRGRRKIRQ